MIGCQACADEYVEGWNDCLELCQLMRGEKKEFITAGEPPFVETYVKTKIEKIPVWNTAKIDDRLDLLLKNLARHYWECGEEGLIDAGKYTPITKTKKAILELCQADLAKRVEGIEDILFNMIPVNYDGTNPEVRAEVSRIIAQAITKHLGGEE